MTYEEWASQRFSELAGLRRGQHLFNTLPTPIADAVRGDLYFDCFYMPSNLPRLSTLAELVWDITDREEIELAMELVRKESQLQP